jgi:hypothetical protein
MTTPAPAEAGAGAAANSSSRKPLPRQFGLEFNHFS